MNQSIAVFPQSFIQNEILLKEILEIGNKYSCSIHLFDPKTYALNDFLNLNKPTIALVGLEKIDSNLLKSNQQLKFVSKFGVGTDNIDFNALSNHSVNFGWTPGVNKRSVSELVLSFALGHCRNVFQSIHKMKEIGRAHV